MIRAEVFERIGLIDERFFLIHEESDFCLRARQAGFRCGVLGEALVWHKGSSSFKRTGKRSSATTTPATSTCCSQAPGKPPERPGRASLPGWST